MDSLERFACCMGRRRPDRPPIDLGATTLTGMRPSCQRRLGDLLGLQGPPEPSNSGVDERLLRWAGTDFRSAGGIADLPSPHTLRVSETCYVDCWGVRREFKNGEWQITEPPLRGASLADLAAFPWPEGRVDDSRLEAWRDTAAALHGARQHVVIAEHPVFGILELGCWMCGYDDFLLRIAADPDFVRAFFDRVLAIQLDVVDAYYGVLGPYIHLTTSGDDFGTQRGPFMSPEMFGEMIAPWFAARIAATKRLTGAYYWHHSCGSVFALVPQLLDCGIDILNPIQTSSAQMEPERLVAAFGDRLVFWGAVDVQQFLPKATPDEVRDEVRRLVAIFGRNGGYVTAPAHEIQDDVPPENVVAWIEAVREGP